MNPTTSTAYPASFALAVAEEETTREEMALRSGVAWSVRDRRAGTVIRILDGTLWITEEGDPEDYLLSPGETFVSTRGGRVVVESLDLISRFVVSAARG